MSSETGYIPPYGYQIPNPTVTTPFNATKLLEKRDLRQIRLQQVDHEINSYNFMRIYIALIFVIVVARLLLELFQTKGPISVPLIIITIIQILGYGFGLHAHTSKNRWQVKIFFFYTLISFSMIAYFLYYSITTQNWITLSEDIATIILNILLLFSCNHYKKLLKERDILKTNIYIHKESLITQATIYS